MTDSETFTDTFIVLLKILQVEFVPLLHHITLIVASFKLLHFIINLKLILKTYRKG